jgi:hypothetical protein
MSEGLTCNSLGTTVHGYTLKNSTWSGLYGQLEAPGTRVSINMSCQYQ